MFVQKISSCSPNHHLMNKKLLFTVLLISGAIFVFACLPRENNNSITMAPAADPGKGIKFVESNWSKALKEAKKQNKLIFLDAYTTWCGPCRMLKQNTFPNQAVGDFFNKNFINIALDMEKGDGPEVAVKYNVTAYPTLIIADGDGNIVAYTRGYINAEQLLEFGKHGFAKKP